jgi:hypothetical protein
MSGFSEPLPGCQAKHTKYQPSQKDWVCPSCEIKVPGDFYVDGSEGLYDCPALHPGDWLRCEECGYETTGRAFVARIIKQESLVKCSCCKGSGYVKAK